MESASAAAKSGICCENLTKRYHGGLLAVNELNLQVNGGEIFGLLGPNGAGKTTTVGMFTTLVVPTSGKAWVAGIDVVAHPALAKQVIGVVSQSNNLDRALTVWENLYYHARYFGIGAKESRETADKMLVEFRLKEHAKADVGDISGGMARRLQLARSLLHSPSVIFLDEPTAGLDPQSRLVLWEIMENLRKGGQTILLTTHDMKEADSLCDRLAIMDHGHVLALDTPKKLKESVAADTIITITAAGDLDRLAQLLRGGIAEITGSQQRNGALQLLVKGATGVLPKVVTIADQGGFNIADISVAEPTLETVFIKLTGKELRE
jgi:ABC-2 type transport system ATP-binding protein